MGSVVMHCWLARRKVWSPSNMFYISMDLLVYLSGIWHFHWLSRPLSADRRSIWWGGLSYLAFSKLSSHVTLQFITSVLLCGNRWLWSHHWSKRLWKQRSSKWNSLGLSNNGQTVWGVTGSPDSTMKGGPPRGDAGRELFFLRKRNTCDRIQN